MHAIWRHLFCGLLLCQKPAETDVGIDHKGHMLPCGPNGVDAEALVKLADGSFWVASEMGPSLLKVTTDGRIMRRLVPEGTSHAFAGELTKIVESLPGILSKRKTNRGIESLALSPDEKFLYFILQGPLANPDIDTYKRSKNVRLFKFDLATEANVAEYVYVLSEPGKFGQDVKQKDLRISEMIALGPDRFLVLERTNERAHFYEITLQGATNILGKRWDKPDQNPSLEALPDLASAGITPVKKKSKEKPVFYTDSTKDDPKKVEGMALLGDGALFLINDNDFGIHKDPVETKGIVIQDKIGADRSTYTR